MNTELDLERRFNDAYQAEWPAVFRFAVAWTNDLAAAEDIAQEAFTRLWTRRASIDWERPVVPWLLVVTRRLATDRFRRIRSPSVAPRVRDIGGAGQPSPSGVRPIEAQPWLDSETGFPAHLETRLVAGTTSTDVVLDLERLDPPPTIVAPRP